MGGKNFLSETRVLCYISSRGSRALLIYIITCASVATDVRIDHYNGNVIYYSVRCGYIYLCIYA